MIQQELFKYNKNVVTKSNNFIELPYKLSLIEQKIILFMVSLVQPGDEKFSLFRFSVSKLIEFLDINTNNYGPFGEIAKIIEGLKEKSIKIKKDHSLLTMSWLTSAEYFD